METTTKNYRQVSNQKPIICKDDALLTSSPVTSRFRVHENTATSWARPYINVVPKRDSIRLPNGEHVSTAIALSELSGGAF